MGPRSRRGVVALILLSVLLTLPALAAETPADPRAEARVELDRARHLSSQGYTDSAIVSYRKAIELDPELVEAYSDLGKILLELKNHAFAIVIYRQLERLEPDNLSWKSVLMDLYEAYLMPREAIATGEAWLAMEPSNAALMLRLAPLYEETNRNAARTAILERYAATAPVDAEFWYNLGKQYGEQGRFPEALERFRKAAAMEPDNLRYQTSLGLAYVDSDRFDEAERHFQDLAAQNPDEPGFREWLAMVYVQHGDDWMGVGRYATAREYYLKAREILPKVQASSEEGSSVGRWRATPGGGVQPLQPEARAYASAPSRDASSVPVSYVPEPRQPPGEPGSSVLESVDQRLALVEHALSPSLQVVGSFGKSGIFRTTGVETTVSYPLAETELVLQAISRYFDLSDGTISENIHIVEGGVRYNLDRNWSLSARAGTEGVYEMGVLTEGESYSAGASIFRALDLSSPLALRARGKVDGQRIFASGDLNEWLGLGGELVHANYSDGNDQTIYSIGPYATVYRGEDKTIQLGYRHSGETNSEPQNTTFRFAPANLQADSAGIEYHHTLSDTIRYRLAYYHSWVNDGGQGDTYEVGADFRLSPDAQLGVTYSLGTFPGGTIPVGASSVEDSNHSLTVDLLIHF